MAKTIGGMKRVKANKGSPLYAVTKLGKDGQETTTLRTRCFNDAKQAANTLAVSHIPTPERIRVVKILRSYSPVS